MPLISWQVSREAYTQPGQGRDAGDFGLAWTDSAPGPRERRGAGRRGSTPGAGGDEVHVDRRDRRGGGGGLPRN